MNRPVFLWGVPRSASTAFERVFIERGDTVVFHEPYSVSFYYSDARRSNRYSGVKSEPEHAYARVTDRIFNENSDKIVFAKEIAYHLRDYWTTSFLDKVDNTFLIRDPLSALTSQYKLLPDFSLEETGYPELKKVFDAVADLRGASPVLIETEDFQTSPHAVMKAYCRSICVPFMETALQWQKKELGIWDEWKRWHIDAIESTTINPPKLKPKFEDQPDHVKHMVEATMPIYEDMIKHKMKV